MSVNKKQPCPRCIFSANTELPTSSLPTKVLHQLRPPCQGIQTLHGSEPRNLCGFFRCKDTLTIRKLQRNPGTYPKKSTKIKNFLHKQVRVWGIFQGYVGFFLETRTLHRCFCPFINHPFQRWYNGTFLKSDPETLRNDK